MEIKVKKFLWQTSVWVGGFQQSGPLVKKLWKNALDVIARNVVTKQSYKSILILGLGCGSAIKPLRQKFPDCHITGIEINSEMIEIGQKYFNLDKVPNLKIKICDARKFISKTKQKFDLILMDIYSGGQEQQIKIPQKILSKKGLIIFNKLSNGQNSMRYSSF